MAGEMAGRGRCAMRLRSAWAIVLILGPVPGESAAIAQTAAASPVARAAAVQRPAWIVKSDADAQVVLDVIARFAPEFGGHLGVAGLDEQVLDLQPQRFEREQAAIRQAIAELEARRARETDPLVKQDIDILIRSARENAEGDELSHKYELTYLDVPLTMFRGLRSLLDDEISPARRPSALVRLRKYAGALPGTTPTTELAQARMR